MDLGKNGIHPGRFLNGDHQRNRLVRRVYLDILLFAVIVKVKLSWLQAIDNVAAGILHQHGRHQNFRRGAVDHLTQVGSVRRSRGRRLSQRNGRKHNHCRGKADGSRTIAIPW